MIILVSGETIRYIPGLIECMQEMIALNTVAFYTPSHGNLSLSPIELSTITDLFSVHSFPSVLYLHISPFLLRLIHNFPNTVVLDAYAYPVSQPDTSSVLRKAFADGSVCSRLMVSLTLATVSANDLKGRCLFPSKRVHT